MGFLFVVLAVISLIVLIVGIVMFLRSFGVITKRKGEDVGAEIMAEGMDKDDEGVEVARAGVFKGTGSKVEANASVSFAEIKDAMATGNWRQALPALFVMSGLVGLLFFGALAIFSFMDNKFVGVAILVFVTYALIRMLIGFVRA